MHRQNADIYFKIQRFLKNAGEQKMDTGSKLTCCGFNAG